ncbi:MAG: hypothetical protein JWN44_992 [Myxococcales bacterium]|nr:hypothetical protein [Myxococcales bacterium]
MNLGAAARAAIVARVDEDSARLLLAAEALEIGADGELTAVARNTFGGAEAAFKLRIRGGMQPSRVGGEVNPLAHVAPDAVVLSSLGDPTERFIEAAAVALDQPAPPPKSRWRKLFGSGPVTGEARFGALLVSREGDPSSPRTLHLKLFCEGGELYLDIDVPNRRVSLVEKDPEFRTAVWKALAALVGLA